MPCGIVKYAVIKSNIPDAKSIALIQLLIKTSPLMKRQIASAMAICLGKKMLKAAKNINADAAMSIAPSNFIIKGADKVDLKI
jgi:hypothetical protein